MLEVKIFPNVKNCHDDSVQDGSQCRYLLQHGGVLQLQVLLAAGQSALLRLGHHLQPELLAQQWGLPPLHGHSLAHQVSEYQEVSLIYSSQT